MKQLIQGLKSVQVRNYQFASDFAYSKADIDAVRSQLSGPAWTELAQVHDQKKNEDVGVYVALDHHKVTGFAVVASEPREFTIINIVGAVDLDKISALQKQLGLPDVGVVGIPPYVL
jgi:predicted nucleotidyltransferase